jgi:hypothetical protein
MRTIGEEHMGKLKAPHHAVDHAAFQTQGDPMLGRLMEDLCSH